MIIDSSLLAHLALADYRERTRRYSFLLILGANLFLSYLVFAGKFTVRLGMCRGAANSAWTGSTIVMTCVLLLGMFGFYLVKNAISRDRDTGVGEILASTPMSRIGYVGAKFVSNFATLVSVLMIIAASAIVMQALAGIEGGFDLWDLLAPFVVIGLPVMALVAAMAIFFESVRWLRGGLGNAIYFILTMSTLPVSMETESPLLDLLGFRLIGDSLQATAAAQFPGELQNLILNPEYIANLKIFYWSGIDWSASIVLAHLFWVGIAVAITGLAVPFFDRFDPSRARHTEPAKTATIPNAAAKVSEAVTIVPGRYCALDFVPRFRLSALVMAELRLSVKGFPKIWYLIGLGLVIAQLTAPLVAVRAYIVPVAFVWPLAIWSAMGTREKRFNTEPLLVSSAYPLIRQLPAAWFTGLLATAMCGSGAFVRATIAGDWGYVGALAVAVVFVPTLALALGTLSGTDRLFEIVYMVIWYLGPLNHLPWLDYVGATDQSLAIGAPYLFLGITVLLLPLGFWARSRQLARS